MLFMCTRARNYFQQTPGKERNNSKFCPYIFKNIPQIKVKIYQFQRRDQIMFYQTNCFG